MTSLSTVSAGITAATSLPTGRQGYHGANLTYFKTFNSALEYAYTGGSGTQTAINLTGSGYLTACYIGSATTSTSSALDITIDGVSVFSDTKTDISNYGIAAVGATNTSGLAGGAYERVLVPFTSSCVVTMSCNVNATCVYDYYLT